MAKRDDRVRIAAKGRRAKTRSPAPILVDPYDAFRHPQSTTTRRVRLAFQRSELSTRELAAQHGVNPKTVGKWRRRTTVNDEPMGPRSPNSYCLERTDGHFVKYYRLFTGFGLDDCLLRLKTVFPQLTRSSLYRCFRRHGVKRLPWGKLTSIEKEAAKCSPGCVHITIYGDDATQFAAIEDGSGHIFCRRLEHSVEGAISFLKQLKEHFSCVVVVFTPRDERIFRYSREELEIHFAEQHPFARLCRQLSIAHLFHELDPPGSVVIGATEHDPSDIYEEV